MIFLFSKLAVFDGQKSIRGGIPIVFRKYLKIMYMNILQTMIYYNL